jgi:hypothetical protein
MNLTYNLTQYYDVNYTIEFQGMLNTAHWYPWDIMRDYIEICHDTDETVINACKILGGTVNVWINGDRTECKVDIKKCSYSDSEVVHVRIPVDAVEDATMHGPYDEDMNTEITS